MKECWSFWSLKLIVIFLFSMTFIPELHAVEGRCVPTPPCYCNEECFRCGPGGCSKPSSPSYQQKPSYDYEAEKQRQLEAERQRQKEETAAKKKQEEFEKSKHNALKSMKGINEGELGLKKTSSDDLGLKNIGDTGRNNYGLKELENNKAIPINSNKESKVKGKKVQKGWQKALGCAMEEVYARAESLGPAGVRFSQDLRNEMTRVFNEAGKPVKDSDDVNIVNLKLDRQVSAGSGSAQRQFIVEVAVHSKGDGNLDVDVQSYFSESAGKKDKQEYLQSFLKLNKSGKVIDGEKSAAVNSCLSN